MDLTQVHVSVDNPLLRRFATLPWGAETYIQSNHPADQVPIYRGRKPVICLDFHQVLDRVRLGRGKGDLRLEGEHLNPHVIRILTGLEEIFSVGGPYCCAPKFREHVRSCCAGRSCVVITSDRTGSIGKLAAVKAQLAPELLQDTFICDDDCAVV